MTGPRVEMLVFAVILLALNWPLIEGGFTARLAFEVDAVHRGEWWRVATHPLVHVSVYHFLLDSAAFLFLYAGWLEPSRWRRLGCVVASAAGSLFAALFASPLITSHGLCGLSGVAHGLMAVFALEIAGCAKDDPMSRLIGLISFIAVIGKCLIESVSGQALFNSLHLGEVGVPIVACHAGGVLGALIWMLLSARAINTRGHYENIRANRSFQLPTQIWAGAAASPQRDGTRVGAGSTRK